MKFFFIAVVSLFCLECVSGQELYFRHYTIDNGLTSNEVHGIMEDSSGLLWLSTDRGILQYDGYRFYEVPVTGAPSIHPWFGIKKDPYTGTLYFTGFKGDVAWYRNGELTLHPQNHQFKQLLPLNGLTSFSARRDSVWLSFDNKNDITLLTPRGEIHREHYPAGLYFNQRYEHLYLIRQDKSGTVPVFITWKNLSITKDTLNLPPLKEINFLHHEQVDSLHLIVAGIEILCYKNGIRQWRKQFHSDILSFHQINDHQFLIGMRNRGVGLYKLQSGILQGPYQIWLKQLSVTNIYKDIQGGLWFTTMENGVFYSHPSHALFWPVQERINAFFTRDDKMFIRYFSGTTHEFYTTNTENNLFANWKMRLANTVPWPDSRLKRAYSNAPGIPNKDSIAIPANIVFASDSSASEPFTITSIQYNDRSGIWVGSFQGLKYYADQKFTDYAHLHPGFSRRITGLNLLEGKHLVVATLGDGLIVMKDSTLYTLNTENGLPATIINDMDVFRDTIWLGTNKGISKVVFERDSFRVWHYGTGYGLPTLGIRKLAVSENWLYFDWVNRVVAIRKDHLKNLPPSAPPTITSVLVNESDTLAPGAELRHNQNTLQFNFHSINLANGPGQLYRYQLEGFDNNWRTTTERQVVFPNLPPGTFKFNLQVADGQGLFLPHTASITFTIRPAIWQRLWFPYFVGLILTLAASLAFIRHLRAVKRRNTLMLSLAENQQKALVQLINPHFIFNVLNSFSSAVATEDRMNALTIISRFTRLIRMSIELARKKEVILSDELDLLQKYLELETIRFPGKFLYSITTDQHIEPENTLIPSMLIQPFVENAIKHGVMHLFGKLGNVSVSLELQNDLLICTVEDNGIGRKKSAEINRHKEMDHESAGIAVTLQRLELLHKEKQLKYIYLITDKEDGQGNPAGTKVIFSLPYKLKRPTYDHSNNRR